MTDFSLPQLAAQAAPEFMDAASAKAWLEHVPLANLGAAQHQMLLQLEEFNRYATSAAVRLEALEALRDAVNFVQIEQAKRFVSCALTDLRCMRFSFREWLSGKRSSNE